MPRSPAFRGFSVTVNNPDGDVSEFFDRLSQHAVIDHAAWQLEVGAEGTPHIQAAIYFHCQRTVGQAIRIIHRAYPTAHVEYSRNYARLVEYVTKDESRQDGPWEFGDRPGDRGDQGKRSDIDRAIAALNAAETCAEALEVLRFQHTGVWLRYERSLRGLCLLKIPERTEAPAEVKVYWGESGTGKTRAAYEELGPNVFVVDESNFSSGSLWFDNYEGQDNVLFDEYRCQVKFGQLLRLLDRYPVRGCIKGGAAIKLPWKKVIFTSPNHPRDWYPQLCERDDGARGQLLRRITSVVHFSLPFGRPGAAH